jgi:hypothetical protein
MGQAKNCLQQSTNQHRYRRAKCEGSVCQSKRTQEIVVLGGYRAS